MNRFWILFPVLTVMACSRGEISPAPNDHSGERLSVSLGWDIAAVAAPSSAAAAVAKSEISKAAPTELDNVWLLQFGASGEKTSAVKLGTVTTGAPIEAMLTAGNNQTLYLVANAGTTDFNAVVDLTTFRAVSIPSSSLTDEASVPLVGRLDGIAVEKLGDGKGRILVHDNSIGNRIQLHRIAAKLEFAYEFTVKDFTLKTVRLMRVPQELFFAEPEPGADGCFPDNTQNGLFGDGTEIAVSSQSGTISWFVPENRRGEVAAVTDQRLKGRKLAPANSTYICAVAEHRNTPSYRLTYSVFPGANSTSNFDVKRNTDYFLQTLLSSDAGSGDSRIEATGKPIVWALGNLVYNSAQSTLTIAISPEIVGDYFKWGSNIGVQPKGSSPWNTSLVVYNPENYPLPTTYSALPLQSGRVIWAAQPDDGLDDPCRGVQDGLEWRMPTYDDLERLLIEGGATDEDDISGSSAGIYNGVNGYWFGAGHDNSPSLANNNIFLPLTGSLNLTGECGSATAGRYWLSTPDRDYNNNSAYFLQLGNQWTHFNTYDKSNGMPIRCVHD